MSDAEIREALHRQLGYVPVELPRALRELRSGSLADAGEPALLRALVDRLTVRHSEWMRHPKHFERLARWLRGRANTQIWSAGCANGLEPLSIAEVARRIGASVTILATDVSEEALRLARAQLARRPTLARLIELERHSIVSPPPGTFDLIFCRNVVMYAPASDAKNTLSRLRGGLRRGGALVVAPVEGLLGAPEGLELTDTLGWFDEGHEHGSAQPTSAAPQPVTPPDPVVSLSLSTETPLLSELLASGDREVAERDALRYVESHESDPYGWFTLGELLRQRGELVQARQCYRTVIDRVASSPPGARASMLKRAAEARLEEGSK